MKTTTFMSLVCSAAMLLWACGHRTEHHDHEAHHEIEESHGVHEHPAGDPHDHEAHHHEATQDKHSDEIVISPEKAAAAGIEATLIEPTTFSGVIKTGGQILPAPADEKTIVAAADGIVSFRAKLTEGTAANAGQALFSIISGNLQDGNRLGKAKTAYEAAAAEYERALKLIDSQIISQKEFISIKERYKNAKMDYEALKPDAEGLGVSIEAPVKGWIRSLYVQEGDFVTTGTVLATISQNRKLTLRADISQRYYQLIENIKDANFSTQYSGKTLNIKDLGGRLLSIGQGSSESPYYIPVTFEFDRSRETIPGAFAEVWLLTDSRENVISVPQSAITEEQGLYFVYLKLDESCYRKQEVSLGESDGSRTEILSGISAGDMVVTAGAVNVKLASASNIIPAHTHNH